MLKDGDGVCFASRAHWYLFLPLVVLPSSPTQTRPSSSVAYARALTSSAPRRGKSTERIPSRHVLRAGSLAGVEGMGTNGLVVEDVRRGTGLDLDAEDLVAEVFAADVGACLLGVVDWMFDRRGRWASASAQAVKVGDK